MCIAVGVVALQVDFLAICVKAELERGRIHSTASNYNQTHKFMHWRAACTGKRHLLGAKE